MFQKPQVFGLSDGSQALLWSFLMVGFWWILFSLPLFRWVHEAPMHDPSGSDWQELLRTFRQVLTMKPVLFFLAGYWLHLDAFDTLTPLEAHSGVKLAFVPEARIRVEWGRGGSAGVVLGVRRSINKT